MDAEKTTKEQRPVGKARLYLLLSGALAVGFLLGYLASAFVPLVRQQQPPAPSTASAPPPAPAAPLSSSEIDALLKAAHAALDAGDLQAAWEKYHQILITNPRHVEALTHLAILLMRSNRLDDAMTLFDRALSLDPQYAHALFDKGQALKAKGDVKGAMEAWRRFLALVPPDSDDAKQVKGWIAELGRSGRPVQDKADGPGSK